MITEFELKMRIAYLEGYLQEADPTTPGREKIVEEKKIEFKLLKELLNYNSKEEEN